MEFFRHNQVAYKNARDMMLRTGKAAVIHPTGTGKSFVAFQLALDNTDKWICWRSPSEYIFRRSWKIWRMRTAARCRRVFCSSPMPSSHC